MAAPPSPEREVGSALRFVSEGMELLAAGRSGEAGVLLDHGLMLMADVCERRRNDVTAIRSKRAFLPLGPEAGPTIVSLGVQLGVSPAILAQELASSCLEAESLERLGEGTFPSGKISAAVLTGKSMPVPERLRIIAAIEDGAPRVAESSSLFARVRRKYSEQKI